MAANLSIDMRPLISRAFDGAFDGGWGL